MTTPTQHGATPTQPPMLTYDAQGVSGDAARLALAKEAADVRERSQAASDKIRARADGWGKGLTTLGTAAVGYLGITRATDVFPIPPGWGWLSIVVFILLGIMFATALIVGWNLSRAARPIVMKSVAKDIPDTNPAEQADVAALFDAYAKANDVGSLDAYDKIGQKIAAEYESLEPGQPQPAQSYSRAAQIRAEVQAAQQRGATLIVRRRMMKATASFAPLACIVAFVFAAVGVGITTDKLDDARSAQTRQTTETLTTIKQCGEAADARTAHQDITLPLPARCSGRE